jgi:hypothetical protein
MARTISAHFDGKVIVPDEPIDLPAGQRVYVLVYPAEPEKPAGPADGTPPATGTEPGSSKFAWLEDIVADLPDAPPDLSSQHDHYLYGTPKR